MKCVICGKEIEKSSYANEVLCSSECFTVNFWNEKVEHKDEFLIIEGRSYWVGDEKDTGGFRGFGGSKFKIRKNTGEIITTTNLWSQGEVPAEFRDRLPDNAEWYKEVQS